MKHLSFAVSVAFLLMAVAYPAMASTKYDIVDLGAGVIPAGVNRNGEVVGTVVLPDTEPEAFVYRNGTVTRLGNFGGTASQGLAINDSADVVGTICFGEYCKQNGYMGIHRGFLWKNGEVTDLFATAGIFEAVKVNNKGLILGNGVLNSTHGVMLYDSNRGIVTDISSEGAEPLAIHSPAALNNFGEAVFTETYCGSCFIKAYLFSQGTLKALPQDVPLGVTDINDAGMIIGDTLYDHRGFTYSGDLTILYDNNKGIHFGPRAINNRGLMVGQAGTSGLQMPRNPMWIHNSPRPIHYGYEPAIYLKGKITPLQEQLEVAGDQWVLVAVVDINDEGLIVGYGTKNEDPYHGFLLIPKTPKAEKNNK